MRDVPYFDGETILKPSDRPAFRATVKTTFVLQSVNFALSLAAVLASSRWLSPAGKGVQSIVVTISQIAAAVLGLGFSGVAGTVCAENSALTLAVGRVFRRIAIFAGLVLLATIALNHVFAWRPDLRPFEWPILFFTLAALCQPFVAVLCLSLGEGTSANITFVASSFSWLAVTCALQAGGMLTPVSAVSAQATGLAIGAAYGWWRATRRIAATTQVEPAASDLTRWSRISFYSFLSATFALIWYRGDILLVSKLGGGASAAGIYSVAVFAAELTLRLPQWASMVLGPEVAADRHLGLRRTLSLLWLSVGLASIAAIVAIAIRTPAEAILVKVAGEGFRPAYMVMLMLLPRVVTQSGIAVLAGNLAGHGYTPWHPACSGVGMLGVFALDFVLIPSMGLQGAAIASFLGSLLGAAVVVVGFSRQNQSNAKDFAEGARAALRMTMQFLDRRTTGSLRD